MRETVHVGLEGRAYDVVIGPDLLAEAGALIAPLLRRKRVVVVSDETVAAQHLDSLRAGLDAADISVEALALPPGEATKCWAELTRTVDWLMDQKVERNDVVIAFGGGVIGDLVGFAAAILRRGVRFVQIPTSLLAQVDSSVGGKTGINVSQGKNLVGAFHQPSLVLADTAVLGTLQARDFLAGYGEVVKYGLLGDAAFFDWLELNAPAMAAGDMALRVEAVRRSVQMKADIVLRDEKEHGDRALLNLGHTFCHALEAATGYSDRLLHGEGVAIGCAMAFELSARLGLCAQEDPSRVRAHLRAMGMKTDLRDIDGDLPDAAYLLDLMGQDKKVIDGKLRFILARSIGDAFVTADVPKDAVLQLLDDGRLTDGHGRTVDFSNCVLVMTSNLGSEAIQGLTESGDKERIEPTVMGIVAQHFRPEFVNRIDDIVVFQPLTQQEIGRIADLQLALLNSRLAEQGLSIQLDDNALEAIVAAGYDPVYGARPLRRAMQKMIENPLADALLTLDLTDVTQLQGRWEDGHLEICIT